MSHDYEFQAQMNWQFVSKNRRLLVVLFCFHNAWYIIHDTWITFIFSNFEKNHTTSKERFTQYHSGKTLGNHIAILYSEKISV